MGMYLGETEFTGVYLGDTELTHLYVGDNEVWGGGEVVVPIHRMAGDSTDLPLTTDSGYIPDLMNPQASGVNTFIARPYEANLFNNDAQIWSSNNKIQMAHDASIRKSMPLDPPTEFTIKFKYSGLQADSIRTPSDGYQFMFCGNSSETGRLDVQYYLSYNDWNLVIVLQRGYGPPTLDVSGHSTGTTSNGIYFRDIDFAWLQNNGEGREFTVCLKDGVVYFYIDDILFCHQEYRSGGRYDDVSIGTRFAASAGMMCPTMQVDKFEIYDVCLFPDS